METTQPTMTSHSQERPYRLEHLKPDFLAYLDTLVGNIIATGGYGKIEIEIANRKVERTWVTTSGKAGHQF